ncbi:Uncharacterised protein [uncultured archaeon]|nr:Uncharacterised protein [uncultured archaeon]
MPGAEKSKLQMRFVNMGQGDFCMIKCPDDKVVVVDCGSMAHLDPQIFETAQKRLRAWTKGKSVHALILTHPDRDHYSEVPRLFLTHPAVKIETIFFSRLYDINSPLGHYTIGGLNNAVYSKHFGTPVLREITINESTKKSLNWEYQENNNGYIHHPKEEEIEKNICKVASGTTKRGTEWSINIVAGNVESNKMVDDKDLDPNSRSLVTLVQLGNDRALLTGDATPEVQEYLYKVCKKDEQLNDLLSDLAAFQIPHHGSDECAPVEDFLRMVLPDSLVVSVDLLNDRHHLPRYSVINAWIEEAVFTEQDTYIDYWKDYGELTTPIESINDIIKEKWEKPGYEVIYNNSRTFCWLKDPENAGPAKSNTGFYGVTSNSFFLYRMKTKKDIEETGMQEKTKNGTADIVIMFTED